MNAGSAAIFIVDDDERVREALRMVLDGAGLPVVPYPSAQDFLSAYVPSRAGCVLLDVRMPGMSGLELQLELNRRGATIPVIFMSGHADVPIAVEAMQQGAFDFVQKPFRNDELLERVHRALARDRETRDHLRHTDSIRARAGTLTTREREVLRFMMQGKSNKVMAGDLGVSQRTLETHRARVMEKMQARSLAELVRMAIQIDFAEEITVRS
jgi:two-component system, LuxR family, response regulator FixJ